MTIRRVLSLMGLVGERRAAGARIPIFVGAHLELDVVEVSGTARDLADGGLFFATSAPIACGTRGHVRREGSRERVPVRVTWQRAASSGQPPGLGLAFE